TPRSIVAVIVSFFGSVALVSRGYRLPWLIGIYLLAASMFLVGSGLGHVHLLGYEFSDFGFLAAVMAIAGLGVGIAVPVSQNAALDLLPDQIAAASGLRAMFGNSGGAIGIAVVTLAIGQFQNEVTGLRVIFL